MGKMSGRAAEGVVMHGDGGMGQKGEGCGKVRWGFNGRQEGWGEGKAGSRGVKTGERGSEVGG